MSKEPINVLYDIHEKFSNIAAVFREKVCEDCNWSLPTFYRKMRARERPHPTEKGKMVSYLSNAERQKIIEIMDEVYDIFRDSTSRYRK